MYPAPPAGPAPDAPITDSYIVSLYDYINNILGLATADRHRHTGEIACIRKLQQAGQVR